MAKHTAHAPDWKLSLGKLRLGPWRGEGAPRPGRVHPSSSWLPELLGRGRHKTQVQWSLRFPGGPENWNHKQRRAQSIWSSQEPQQHRWGEHTPVSRANPVWLEHGECSPHTAVSACSTPPFPQQDWTSEPEQHHLCTPVSGWKLDTEETSK